MIKYFVVQHLFTYRLSRNQIIDILDTNVDSAQMLLTEGMRSSLKLNGSHFEKKKLMHISKYIKVKVETTVFALDSSLFSI